MYIIDIRIWYIYIYIYIYMDMWDIWFIYSSYMVSVWFLYGFYIRRSAVSLGLQRWRSCWRGSGAIWISPRWRTARRGGLILPTIRPSIVTSLLIIWLVVSNIFYLSICWEESSQLTNIVQRGSNHQPAIVIFVLSYIICITVWYINICWFIRPSNYGCYYYKE